MMVITRSILPEPHAMEEKKDDDEPIEPSTRLNSSFSDRRQDQKRTGSPLLLLLCASGITSCYLWYGTVQEQLFKVNSSDSDQSITLFLLSTGTFSSFLIALMWTYIQKLWLNTTKQPQEEKASARTRLNHPLLLLTAVTYLSAMAASNESLHYVSYPTCVLAKSSKLIPTMVVGRLVDHYRGRNGISNDKSHSTMEWMGAVFITTGIISFQLSQLHKQQSRRSHHGDNQRGDSPHGLALLGLSLFMDGLLGACQNALKEKHANISNGPTTSNQFMYTPPTAMETMLYTNLYATIFLLPSSYFTGQFQNGWEMLHHVGKNCGVHCDEIPALLFKLNLSASLGQVFIFLTIHHFSPLICTTITTTRKFFTILLSVYKFGHVLDIWQWGSVGLVFGGLYLEIISKTIDDKPAISPETKAKLE